MWISTLGVMALMGALKVVYAGGYGGGEYGGTTSSSSTHISGISPQPLTGYGGANTRGNMKLNGQEEGLAGMLADILGVIGKANAYGRATNDQGSGQKVSITSFDEYGGNGRGLLNDRLPNNGRNFEGSTVGVAPYVAAYGRKPSIAQSGPLLNNPSSINGNTDRYPYAGGFSPEQPGLPSSAYQSDSWHPAGNPKGSASGGPSNWHPVINPNPTISNAEGDFDEGGRGDNLSHQYGDSDKIPNPYLKQSRRENRYNNAPFGNGAKKVILSDSSHILDVGNPKSSELPTMLGSGSYAGSYGGSKTKRGDGEIASYANPNKDGSASSLRTDGYGLNPEGPNFESNRASKLQGNTDGIPIGEVYSFGEHFEGNANQGTLGASRTRPGSLGGAHRSQVNRGSYGEGATISNGSYGGQEGIIIYDNDRLKELHNLAGASSVASASNGGESYESIGNASAGQSGGYGK
uniref:DUF4766 domain-containing protein n=1 Tax=Stomoxys calcitrans TaxID=35570 RepID=A0A1I8PLR7_STOCA